MLITCVYMLRNKTSFWRQQFPRILAQGRTGCIGRSHGNKVIIVPGVGKTCLHDINIKFRHDFIRHELLLLNNFKCMINAITKHVIMGTYMTQGGGHLKL
jgi:hypothetical protein